MKFRPSFATLCIATCALTTQGCGRSIAQLQPQTAAIPARLLADPAPLPEMPRTADPVTGKLTITGTQCLTGAADLYDVAGAIRGQLTELIAVEKARQAQPPAKKKRKLF